MKKLNNISFIERAQSIHGDRYDYSYVEYVNMSTKVVIVCPDHGNFSQSPSNHILKRAGCPTCARLKFISNSKSRAKDTQWFITQSVKIHKSQYDYTKVLYKNQQEPVEIVCPTHGSFFQRPSDHIYGKHGCPKCGLCHSKISRIKGTRSFIEESRRIHGDVYDYQNVNYANGSTPVTITCSKHGKFEQKPQYHTKGSGCPKCAGTRGEKMILHILDKHNIPYVFQHSFHTCVSRTGTKLVFDFYLPNHNILIEFDGELHEHFIPHFHKSKTKFEELKERDNIKNTFAEREGMMLVRLKELKYETIENLIVPLF